MAYLRPFLRLVAIGSLFDSEQFSFSMSLVQAGGGPAPAPTEVPASIIAAFNTFWTTAPIGARARLKTLKLNEIGTDGKYTGDDTVLHDYVASGIPGPSSAYPPPQIAYAVTLRTARARGRASRGRFYVPLPSNPIDVTGTVNAGGVLQWKTATDLLLNAINDGVPGFMLGVVSKVGAGAENPVQHASYGRVLDTIRSRREDITEDYVDGVSLGNPE